MKFLKAYFLLLCFTVSCFSLEKNVSSNEYVEYIPGDLPIIISAPHGGRKKDKSIADRKNGVLTSDANTDLLARQVYDAFAKTGKTPHLVICHLHRIKVDCNRNEKECYEGDPKALAVWKEFQNSIEKAKKVITAKGQKVLFVDLHGHGHEIPRLELGYLLSSKELFLKEAAFNKLMSKSSFKGLVDRADFESLIRGPESIGTLLEEEGFPSVPSSKVPDPGKGNKYFNGGYNTVRHGAQNSPNCYSVQIEMNKPGVRDTDENRKKFAAALSRVLNKFYKQFLKD